jgi:hypothetical protein|tara:strand:- start:282 stop:458 length:177 start_codon:yes stop_codon:yes gene_type:complete
MEDKDWKKPFFEKKEEKPITKKAIKKDTKGLNDPSVPMRRKNRILGDGRDWFDTHPDA